MSNSTSSFASSLAALGLFLLACFSPALTPAAAKEESAEIKLLVSESSIADARKKLGIDGEPEKRYRVYFLETKDPAAFPPGVILRLRDKGDGKTEVTLKYRPESPDATGVWKSRMEKEREWIVGKGDNVSYSIERSIEGTKLLDKPQEHVGEFFSDAQKAVYREITGKDFDPAPLVVYGPISAGIWKWEDKLVDDKVGAELWQLGPTPILELSRKAKAEKLEEKATAFADAFKDRVQVDPNPASKTQKALKFFRK